MGSEEESFHGNLLRTTIHHKTEVKIEGSGVKLSRFSFGTAEHWFYDLEQLNLSLLSFSVCRVVARYIERAQWFPAPNSSHFVLWRLYIIQKRAYVMHPCFIKEFSIERESSHSSIMVINDVLEEHETLEMVRLLLGP